MAIGGEPIVEVPMMMISADPSITLGSIQPGDRVDCDGDDDYDDNNGEYKDDVDADKGKFITMTAKAINHLGINSG